MGKNNKIGSIVRIRQMLKQWRKKSHIRSTDLTSSSDVPPGHVAVSVGLNHRRYILCAKHLNHPIFRRLLTEAEEEYGFSNVGLLTIPCDELLFEEIMEAVTRSDSSTMRCSHVAMVKKVDYLCESRPLLPRIAEKSVC